VTIKIDKLTTPRLKIKSGNLHTLKFKATIKIDKLIIKVTIQSGNRHVLKLKVTIKLTIQSGNRHALKFKVAIATP
jgi:hypothetical protein